MNDHPEELLAEYVEGSLDPADLGRIETHLATCQRCREEVELSTQARAVLASLPDLEAPPDISLAVRRRSRGAPSRTLRWVGTAAAAAAIVAGGVVVISNLGSGAQQSAGGDATTSDQEPSRESEAPAPAAGGGGVATDQTEATFGVPAPPIIPVYLETGHDYEGRRLASLARRLRDDARAALDLGLAGRAKDFYATFDPAGFTPDVRQAIRCVLAEVPPTQLIVPFRVEAATFHGTPAYIAAFLQGPSPEEAYDRIVMWVVDRESCSLLSLASQVL